MVENTTKQQGELGNQFAFFFARKVVQNPLRTTSNNYTCKAILPCDNGVFFAHVVRVFVCNHGKLMGFSKKTNAPFLFLLLKKQFFCATIVVDNK